VNDSFRRKIYQTLILGMIITHSLGAQAQVWNNPHVSTAERNIAYLAFTNPPKTLDPARSYATDEAQFIGQIYEPPLQYHYLKRPYTLVPLSAANMPTVTYYDSQGQQLPNNADAKQIAYSIYDITIQPEIFYQPHPAFARDSTGQFYYQNLNPEKLTNVYTLSDFKYNGTRELIADDFVYEIKRLADPSVQSPIYGFMSRYIVGLSDLAKQLQKTYRKINLSAQIHPYIDLRKYPLAGVKVIDRYHYQIKIKGFYPQFNFWLAMTFFAPVPWEAERFYAQKGMLERNLSLDWYPVGAGPYLLTDNNPNRRMILTRNPNFHNEFFPSEGEPGDAEKGYLQNSGKKLPFIDKIIFTLDRESIPRWNKFMQGYYDISEVGADSFDQAIHLDSDGGAHLTSALMKKGIRLSTTVSPSIYYTGFNMLDPIIGGYAEAPRLLRRAIAIALNQEEFISIFLNGRGIPAQGPIPPGIFGYQSGESGINPYVYNWQNNRAVRKPLSDAQALMRAAGYPNGTDPKTGKPLILNYDLTSSGGPDDNAEFNWYRKQFAKLGIDLNIRATLYNRFQDKVRTGAAQMFAWGWVADYPDPEDFLFLLYGPNGKVKFGGENATNYANPQADELFTQLANLPNGAEREQKIQQFIEIVRQDGPWIWGFNPIIFTLKQSWVAPSKPNAMAGNTLKYLSIDGDLREKLRQEWNKPQTWPLWLLLILIILMCVPLTITYWLREHRPGVKKF
jgi:oligopeptide transport system substrate-binding protein